MRGKVGTDASSAAGADAVRDLPGAVPLAPGPPRPLRARGTTPRRRGPPGTTAAPLLPWAWGGQTCVAPLGRVVQRNRLPMWADSVLSPACPFGKRDPR